MFADRLINALVSSGYHWHWVCMCWGTWRQWTQGESKLLSAVCGGGSVGLKSKWHCLLCHTCTWPSFSAALSHQLSSMVWVTRCSSIWSLAGGEIIIALVCLPFGVSSWRHKAAPSRTGREALVYSYWDEGVSTPTHAWLQSDGVLLTVVCPGPV